MNVDFWDVMAGRRSIRRYTGAPVPPSTVNRVLRAASRAPSAHNAQPWRFVVIASQDVRVRLVKRMAERYDRDMVRQGTPEAVRARRLRRSMELMGAAPVMIVAFLSGSPGPGVDPARSTEDQERLLGIQSVAVAVENLLLAACASGLGACWYSAPLFCPDVVNGVLGPHASGEPMALVTLGYPDESPAPKSEKKLNEIVTYV
jgi:coenzyme F420-0:L-glutamate ligase/coenzyme F420-1:gamma-L-glutamate ligase